jgi:hypothetical protein
VAQAGLAVEAHHAQRAAEAEVQDAGFVGGGRRGQHAGAEPAVDALALVVLLDEVGVAIVLEQARDAFVGFVPADALPLVAAGFTHLGVLQALVRMDVVQRPCTLGAQRAAADGVVGVALDVEDPGLGVLGAVAQAVHQHAAAHRAVGAVVAGFLGAQQLVLAGQCGHGHRWGKAQGCSSGAGDTGTAQLEETSSAVIHHVLFSSTALP